MSQKLLKSWATNGSRLLYTIFGGIVSLGSNGFALTTLTYGPAIAIDASLGNFFSVSVTDAVAFAFSAPTNPPPTGVGALMYITVRNTSGGAHGAGTWNAVFKVTGAIAAIATGFSRTFAFRWDGTNWVQFLVPVTDIPN